MQLVNLLVAGQRRRHEKPPASITMRSFDQSLYIATAHTHTHTHTSEPYSSTSTFIGDHFYTIGDLLFN